MFLNWQDTRDETKVMEVEKEIYFVDIVLANLKKRNTKEGEGREERDKWGGSYNLICEQLMMM